MVATKCDMNAPTDSDLEGNERYGNPIVFAVPTAWKGMGRGSGGSGSVTDTHVTLDFETESGDNVKVEYDWDRRGMNGEILGPDQKPSKSFDYDIIREKSTTPIKYDKVAKASVGDQDVEAIVGSFNMPTCVWDNVVVKEETMRNIDLNGDGKIKPQSEYQQELQDKLDELKKKNEK